MWEILICKLALKNVAPPSLKSAPTERGVNFALALTLKNSICVRFYLERPQYIVNESQSKVHGRVILHF